MNLYRYFLFLLFCFFVSAPAFSISASEIIETQPKFQKFLTDNSILDDYNKYNTIENFWICFFLKSNLENKTDKSILDVYKFATKISGLTAVNYFSTSKNRVSQLFTEAYRVDENDAKINDEKITALKDYTTFDFVLNDATFKKIKFNGKYIIKNDNIYLKFVNLDPIKFWGLSVIKPYGMEFNFNLKKEKNFWNTDSFSVLDKPLISTSTKIIQSSVYERLIGIEEYLKNFLNN